VLLKNNQLLQEVVVTGYATTRVVGRMGGISRRCSVKRSNIVKDTISNWINNFNPSVKIYPNPAQDILTIISKEKIKRIVLYDASGRKAIISNQFDKTNILLPVRQLSPGVYWVNVVTAQNTHSIKFIKQ
jgi:hypothetical protein